ncbi:MAG: malate:quinone oxidoreductase, partial [Sphingomonas sp.]
MTSTTAAKAGGVTRRNLLGSAIGAGVVGGASMLPMAQADAATTERNVDVLLVGGGIMSATLAVLLHQLEPSWTIELVERLDKVAEESSN